MTDQLKDQVAIITGAGKGLGRTFAIHLADRGVRVVVNNRKREPEGTPGSADLTVAAIRERGGTAIANHDPVDDPDSGERMVQQALEAFGRLDIVVPNAAISPERTVHRMPLDHFRQVMDINFFGGLHLTRAAIPHLRAEGYGRLVFVISTAGLHGGHGLAAYSASKAALVALMQCVAVENGDKGIRSNALAPYAATRDDQRCDARPAPRALDPRSGRTRVGLAGEPRVSSQRRDRDFRGRGRPSRRDDGERLPDHPGCDDQDSPKISRRSVRISSTRPTFIASRIPCPNSGTWFAVWKNRAGRSLERRQPQNREPPGCSRPKRLGTGWPSAAP